MIEKGENMGANMCNKTKKKRGARIAAVVMILIMLVWDIILMSVCVLGKIPILIGVVLVASPTAIIIGVIIALRERIKEIEGGEEDAATNY